MKPTESNNVQQAEQMLNATLEETVKSPSRSKTIWLQLLVLISLSIPQVRDHLESNPVSCVALLAALNVLVRFATRDRVALFPSDGKESVQRDELNGGGGGNAAACIMAGMTSVLLGGTLTSCSMMQSGTPVSGTIYYAAPNGAKAGITLTGTPRINADK